MPGQPESDDVAEWVIPVRWIASSLRSAAYRERGLFANQNSACKLRQEFPSSALPSTSTSHDQG